MESSPALHTRPRTFLILLGLLALALLLVFLRGLPTWPRRADDPPQHFSAYRALDDLKAVFGEDGTPHPPGSIAHDQVLERLQARLVALGYTPQVQETTACRPTSGVSANCVAVQNVLARLDGTLSGPAVMLVTHYDSVYAGPGIADDAAGVAALLEAARILRAAPEPYRNPVIFLFTDAEESYSIGAQGFVDQHPWARQVAVVINLEARGTSGESFMFETGPGNAWLMEAVAAARRPVANSMMVEAYRLMPSSTDMSVFLEAGLTGLNFAFVGNNTRYHTPFDNIENLSLGSLQHQGESVLAAAQSLANMDLRAERSDKDAAYTDLLGFSLLRWPQPWTLPLALLVVLLLAASLAWVYWKNRPALAPPAAAENAVEAGPAPASPPGPLDGPTQPLTAPPPASLDEPTEPLPGSMDGPTQPLAASLDGPTQPLAAPPPVPDVPTEPLPASPPASQVEAQPAVPAVLHQDSILIARPEPPQPGEPLPPAAPQTPAPALPTSAAPPRPPRRAVNLKPLGPVGWGLLAAFLVTLLSALLGWGLTSLVSAVTGELQPWYAYPLFMRLALWILPLFLAALAALLFARRAGGLGLALGAWSLWALFGLFVAIGLAGGAIYLILPSLLAAVLLLGLLLSGLHRKPLAREIAFAIPALLAVLLLARLAAQFEAVLDFMMPYVITLALGLAAATFLPLFDLPPGQALPRRWLLLGSGGVLVLALILAAVLPTYSPARPQPLNFYYLADVDAGTARWTAFEDLETLPASLQAFFSDQGAARLDTPYPWVDWQVPVAAAPAFTGQPAGLEVLSDITYEGGARIITLAIHTPRNAPEIDLVIPLENLDSLEVNSKKLAVDPADAWDGMYYLQCSGSCEGFEVTLTLNTPAPLTVYLREISYGLPVAAGQEADLALPPRPALTTPIHSGDLTVVWKGFDF